MRSEGRHVVEGSQLVAYVTTYVCDFVDTDPPPYDRRKLPCRRLASSVCCLCDKHGCLEHLGRVLRATFTVNEPGLLPPALPLPGIVASSIAASYMGFENFKELDFKNKQALCRQETDEIPRAFAERRVCTACALLLKNPDVSESIRVAVDGFVDCVRADLAQAAMAAKKGEEAA